MRRGSFLVAIVAVGLVLGTTQVSKAQMYWGSTGWTTYRPYYSGYYTGYRYTGYRYAGYSPVYTYRPATWTTYYGGSCCYPTYRPVTSCCPTTCSPCATGCSTGGCYTGGCSTGGCYTGGCATGGCATGGCRANYRPVSDGEKIEPSADPVSETTDEAPGSGGGEDATGSGAGGGGYDPGAGGGASGDGGATGGGETGAGATGGEPANPPDPQRRRPEDDEEVFDWQKPSGAGEDGMGPGSEDEVPFELENEQNGGGADPSGAGGAGAGGGDPQDGGNPSAHRLPQSRVAALGLDNQLTWDRTPSRQRLVSRPTRRITGSPQRPVRWISLPTDRLTAIR